MKYSFEDLTFEYDFAHQGVMPIYFSRVATKSESFVFNFLDFVKIPVAASIGRHTHARDNQEAYIIISGKGMMTVDEESFEVKCGDVIVNSIGGTHQLTNTGESEICLVVIEAPFIE